MKKYITRIKSGRFALLLSTIILAIGLSGCQNDGYIGSLFGTWSFDEITVDGNPLMVEGTDGPEKYVDGLMIAFQGDMFRMDQAYSHACIFGTWVKEGNRMVLNGSEDYKSGYFPVEFGTPTHGIFTITIISESNKKMVWERIGDDGKVWRYTLRKLL